MQIFRRKAIFHFSRFKFSFHLPKTRHQQTLGGDFQTQTKGDGTLNPVADDQLIRDVEDKFGLEEIKDYKTILAHLQETKDKYPLNDLVYFFRHLTHLVDEGIVPIYEVSSNNNFKKLVNHVKKRLREGDHERFPHIGSYAYCFKKLNLRDEQLWETLERKVLDDEYYPNFKESVYAVQGFTQLPKVIGLRSYEKVQVRIDEVYKRLERIIRITIWEVDQLYYQKISTSLAEVNRFDQDTFAKLEQHILTNLSFDYSTKTMVDILLAFAKGRQGSVEFYNSMQYVIFKGHMFNRNIFLQNRIEIQFNGQIVSGLLEIYYQAQKNFHNFQLHPNFLQLMYKVITNEKTIYDLNSATKTIHFLPDYEDKKDIIKVIFQKLEKMDGCYHQMEEILIFYKLIEDTVQQKDEVPFTIFKKIEEQFMKNIDYYCIDEVVQYLEYLFQRPKFVCYPIGLQQQLLKVIDTKINEIDYQQIIKLQNLFDSQIQQFFIESQNNITFEQPIKKKSFIQRLLKTQEEVKKVNDSQDKEIILESYKETLRRLEDFRIIQKYQTKIIQQNRIE